MNRWLHGAARSIELPAAADRRLQSVAYLPSVEGPCPKWPPGLNVCNGPEGHAIGRPQGQPVGDSSGSLLFTGRLVRDGADLVPQRQHRVRSAAWHPELERSDPTAFQATFRRLASPRTRRLLRGLLSPMLSDGPEEQREGAGNGRKAGPESQRRFVGVTFLSPVRSWGRGGPVGPSPGKGDSGESRRYALASRSVDSLIGIVRPSPPPVTRNMARRA
jgi:hypothetical protein